MAQDPAGFFGSDPLTYEAGLHEIDNFLPWTDPASRQQLMNQGEVSHEDANAIQPDIRENEFGTFLQEMDAMVGVEAAHALESDLGASSTGPGPITSKLEAASYHDKSANEALSYDVVSTSITREAAVSTPAVVANLSTAMMDVPPPSPHPPSSSNRGELQAEMRNEEASQGLSPSTTAALPFSLSGSVIQHNLKRLASVSPLALRGPPAKNAKSLREDDASSLLPETDSSRLVHDDSPHTGGPAASSSNQTLPLLVKAEQRGLKAALEEQGPESTLPEQSSNQDDPAPRAPLRRGRRGRPANKNKPTPSNVTRSLRGSQEPQAEIAAPQSSADQRIETANKHSGNPNVKDGLANTDKPAAARSRPSLGKNELKDIVATNAAKGAQLDLYLQRMTRGRKHELEAAKPNAKEAVKRRRKSGVKDAK